MADAKLKVVLEQAGSVKGALDQVIDQIQQTISSIDRIGNVKAAWDVEVTAESLHAEVRKLLDDFVSAKDLTELRAALVAFRDKHQGE